MIIEHIDVNDSTKRYWDCNLQIQRFEPLKNTPSVLVCLSSIPFWDVSKYCPVFKNKNDQFTNIPIILLLYFQNYYLKRQITNILKKSI